MAFLDYMKKLGVPAKSLVGRGTENRGRKKAPLGVIIHTPGITFIRKQRDALGDKCTSKRLQEACAVAFDERPYQPNIIIGYDKVYLLEDTDHRPMHAGSLKGSVYARDWRQWAKPLGGKGWELHKRDGHVVYDWWDKVYSERANPTKVFPWGANPNDAVGIDLLPDPSTNTFSDWQLSVLEMVVASLARLHEFPIDKFHVVSHSYASPCERGTVKRRGEIVGVHWDPKNFDFDHVAVAGIDVDKLVCEEDV